MDYGKPNKNLLNSIRLSRRVNFNHMNNDNILFTKIYYPNGELTLHFALDDTEGIQKFTGRSVIDYPTEDDPVFGKAFAIPCSVKYLD